MDDHPHTCLSRAIWLMCDINLKLRIYVFLCLSSFARRLLNMGVIQSLCRLAEIVCWLGEYIGVLLFLCDRREDNAFLFPFFYYHYLFEGGIFHRRHIFHKDCSHDYTRKEESWHGVRRPPCIHLRLNHGPAQAGIVCALQSSASPHDRELGLKARDKATRSWLYQAHKLGLTRVGARGIH